MNKNKTSISLNILYECKNVDAKKLLICNISFWPSLASLLHVLPAHQLTSLPVIVIGVHFNCGFWSGYKLQGLALMEFLSGDKCGKWYERHAGEQTQTDSILHKKRPPNYQKKELSIYQAIVNTTEKREKNYWYVTLYHLKNTELNTLLLALLLNSWSWWSITKNKKIPRQKIHVLHR
jgi:hypothetical protein